MARIAGIDIPREKKIPYSLCYIHGIGLTTAKQICEKAKVDQDARVKDLSDDQVASVRDAITSLDIKVEGCLLYTSPSPRDKRQSRMPSSA